MQTLIRTSILRGLDPAPFQFCALEDAPPSRPPTFAPLFEAESAVLEDEFVPLFATDARPASPEPTEADPTPAPALTYEDGLEDGREERSLEVAALEAEVARLTKAQADAADAERKHNATTAAAVERLSALWAESVRALEADLAALAIDAAEGILDAPATSAQRAAASAGLGHAIDELSGGPAISVSIHPVDYLHVRESGLVDALSGANPGLHWDSDASLDEGDWRASSDDGAVHRVRSEMLEALRDRLGLSTSTS